MGSHLESADGGGRKESTSKLFVGDGFELVLAVAGKCLGVPSPPPPPEGLVGVLTDCGVLLPAADAAILAC